MTEQQPAMYNKDGAAFDVNPKSTVETAKNEIAKNLITKKINRSKRKPAGILEMAMNRDHVIKA
jgi:hypothetical protein